MEKYYEKLMLLSSLFVSVIIISNIIAGKLVNIGPFVITLSVLIYPVSFGISNIIFEIYGEKIIKKVILIGFIASIILAIYSFIVILYPPSQIFDKNESYVTVFNNTPRIILASFLAYLSAQFSNIWIFKFLKNLKVNNLTIRNTISMIITQFIDSVVFVGISFLGNYSFDTIISMILSQYIIKLVISILNGPIINFSVKRIKNTLVYDK
ncbi:transporter [Thermosipho melanesiensis]|uniref:Probable queuosine precursor transporter n=2 Tax=Thermosipho melanesiensis TaxID=46541 RepID=A6LP52_THEM4|nr:queuosine precursor transporter [Thermosipho melanesiensis]ABR31703.1 conserved hypothetical integral membrane protein [Thermosipho melanesiensis BI429]APT74726.1 transporter [Thermosipho melanesiensis]OOC35227.1 transporter [Thermosipho melanesiensis]OOC35437.1 transporter [Thermosipho melanesiensis]OOC36688.1 transporter [Thermosipho melanesiensis]